VRRKDRRPKQKVAEFRRFQQLNRDFVEVNTAICQLRSVESVAPRKKNGEAIQKEVAQEIDQLLRVIFADLRKSGRLDLEAVEMATRTAMHQAGAAVLKELLQEISQ